MDANSRQGAREQLQSFGISLNKVLKTITIMMIDDDHIVDNCREREHDIFDKIFHTF